MSEQARAIPPFEDIELELERRGAILLCANRLSLKEYQATAQALVAWADAHLPAVAAAGVRSWTGFGAYRAGDFERSAEMYLQAAGPEIPARFRLSAIRNAVMALCHTPQLDKALALAREGITLADELRRVANAVELTGLVATIEYSLGREQAVRLDLIEAFRLANVASHTGPALVTQAAIAWRAGNDRTARALALEAAENFGAASNPFGTAAAHALACAAGDFVTAEDVERWMHDAVAGPPNIARQAAALFAIGGVPWGGPVPDAPSFARTERRAEVLSEHESASALQGAFRRP